MALATKRRSRANEMLSSEQEKLSLMAIWYIEQIGGLRNKTSKSYMYTLPTPLGILQVSAYEDCLHCCFDEHGPAFAAFGEPTISRHNCKYNTYAQGRMKADAAFQNIYRPHLDRIWKIAGQVVPEPKMSFADWVRTGGPAQYPFVSLEEAKEALEVLRRYGKQSYCRTASVTDGERIGKAIAARSKLNDVVDAAITMMEDWCQLPRP